MVQSVYEVFLLFFGMILEGPQRHHPCLAWYSMLRAPDTISAARFDFNLQPNKNTSSSRASQVMSAEHAELQGSHEELQLGCISL